MHITWGICWSAKASEGDTSDQRLWSLLVQKAKFSCEIFQTRLCAMFLDRFFVIWFFSVLTNFQSWMINIYVGFMIYPVSFQVSFLLKSFRIYSNYLRPGLQKAKYPLRKWLREHTPKFLKEFFLEVSRIKYFGVWGVL